MRNLFELSSVNFFLAVNIKYNKVILLYFLVHILCAYIVTYYHTTTNKWVKVDKNTVHVFQQRKVIYNIFCLPYLLTQPQTRMHAHTVTPWVFEYV